MIKQLKQTDVLSKYQHVHSYQVKGYHVYFNAKANMYSLAILNQAEQKLMQFIDGMKNLKELFVSAKSHKSMEQMLSTCDYLRRKNIVYAAHKEPMADTSPTKMGSIWFHVSNQCNLRCTYCYIKKTNDHLDTNQGKMYAEKAFKVLKQQGMVGVNVKLAGGEPTLRFEECMLFADYLRELGQKYDLQVDITLLTNGTLLNAAKAKRLKEKKIDVSVSLDGVDESNNINRPYINGKGSLDKVLDCISMLKTAGVNINISVVITPQTIDHFPQVIAYCLERRIPYIIQFARENTFSVGDVQADNAKLTEGMLRVFNEIRKNFPHYSVLQGHLDNVSFSRAHSEPVCGVDNSYIVISDKGEVSPCHMFMDKPVGSILDEDIADKLFKAKHVTNGITSEQKSDCKTCEWRYVCAGSCPATTLLTYGESGRKSPFCESYKALIPELLKLEAERVITMTNS